MNVSQFIHSCKQVARSVESVNVVIGNQSTDIDSVACAIALAYYFNEGMPTIPVINSNKFTERRLFNYLCSVFKFSKEDVIFLGELPSRRMSLVALVDHNELDAQEKEFADKVWCVIDHHQDACSIDSARLLIRCIDPTVVSCSSLVALKLKNANTTIDASFAELLLTAIVFDTHNLTLLRTSQKDREALHWLESRAPHVNREELWQTLEKIVSAPPRDNESVLEEDLKIYEKDWAMSSVNFRLRDWLPKNGTQIDSFMRVRGLEFFFILSKFRDSEGSYSRELLAMDTDGELIRGLCSRDDLKLICEESNRLKLFEVLDGNLSRKHWQPVISDLINKVK